MPGRNRQRAPDGKHLSGSDKKQPFEVDGKVLLGYGKKGHTKWGHQFQFHKKVFNFHQTNPFVKGMAKVAESERLQSPAAFGDSEGRHTVNNVPKLLNRAKPKPADQQRPWWPEAQHGGNQHSQVVPRPVRSPQRAAGWPQPKDRSEMPISREERAELSQQAVDHARKKWGQSRMPGTGRECWSAWETGIDAKRLQGAVSRLCGRGEYRGLNTKESVLSASCVKTLDMDPGFASTVRRKQQQQRAQFRPGSAISSRSVGTPNKKSKRPHTAAPNRLIPPAAAANTLGLPHSCLSSTGYDLLEQQNAFTKSPIYH